MAEKKEKTDWMKGYEAGYKEGVGKRTVDQCCCIFDEADEIIQLCAVHETWLNGGMKKTSINVPEPT